MICTSGCGYCGRCTAAWDEPTDESPDVDDVPESDTEDESARADADLFSRYDMMSV